MCWLNQPYVREQISSRGIENMIWNCSQGLTLYSSVKNYEVQTGYKQEKNINPYQYRLLPCLGALLCMTCLSWPRTAASSQQAGSLTPTGQTGFFKQRNQAVQFRCDFPACPNVFLGLGQWLLTSLLPAQLSQTRIQRGTKALSLLWCSLVENAEPWHAP